MFPTSTNNTIPTNIALKVARPCIVKEKLLNECKFISLPSFWQEDN